MCFECLCRLFDCLSLRFIVYLKETNAQQTKQLGEQTIKRTNKETNQCVACNTVRNDLKLCSRMEEFASPHELLRS